MEPPPRLPASTGPKATASLPGLTVLPQPTSNHTFLRPAKRINESPHVAQFLTSQAYRGIGLFTLQLNRACCPRKQSVPGKPSSCTIFTLNEKRYTTEAPASIQKLRSLLEKSAALIDEAPPDHGPRRFGNVSFRKWFDLLEKSAVGMLREFMGDEIIGPLPSVTQPTPLHEDGGELQTPATAMDEVKSYFVGSFGSSQRLDFGTGHELSFLAFLGCLWKLGAFSNDSTQYADGDMERCLVFGVIEPYLRVIRRLILTYSLEPAGSHGVWGLDDHFFLSYIFGSAQLTRPIDPTSQPPEPMPIEGSAPRAPRTGDILKPEMVEIYREMNMYFSAVAFIHEVKKGPFWEHSPILFDVSDVRDGWGKINKGMIKMFNAEVLSKFPVVQHFHFGSLFSWERDPDAVAPQTSVHMANPPQATAAVDSGSSSAATGTTAPWAQATSMPGNGSSSGPGIPYSRVPGPGAPSGISPTTVIPGRQAPGPARGGPRDPQISVTKAPWTK